MTIALCPYTISAQRKQGICVYSTAGFPMPGR